MQARKLKVLIVDDEPVIADTLTKIVRQRGYECELAYDGLSAVEIARRIRPQFILMNMEMPRMGGPSAAAVILNEQPDCQVVFTSGRRESERFLDTLRQRGYAFGFELSPLHPALLLEKLDALEALQANDGE
jgi:CheY-like chemotaxis protein